MLAISFIIRAIGLSADSAACRKVDSVARASLTSEHGMDPFWPIVEEVFHIDRFTICLFSSM